MRKKTYIIERIVFSCFIIIFISCTPYLYKDTFIVSGTYLKVTSPYKEAAKIVYEEFKRLDKIFNPYNPHSEITKLNRSYNKPIKVSSELIEIIKLSQDVYNLTEGAFDVSKGALFAFWKKFTRKKRIKKFPLKKDIDAVKDLGGMDSILIDEENRTITLKKKGLVIDLCGIAKGFMVDKAARKLKEEGIDSAIIDAGGDIYCLGKNRGELWVVGIKDPLNKREIVYPFGLSDEAVATSGNYEQFFEYEGRKYPHLISPFTGYPLDNNILSVSVVAGNTTTADSLATAFFVMGLDGIKNFLSKNISTLKIVVVTKEKEGKKIHVFE
jgi:thiamine biosynthesis lipoprotein